VDQRRLERQLQQTLGHPGRKDVAATITSVSWKPGTNPTTFEFTSLAPAL
jgi:hypothetical protein